MKLDDEVVDAFRDLDVACVADVMEGSGDFRNCTYAGLTALDRDHRFRRVCGRARTVRLIPIQEPANWRAEERSPALLLEGADRNDVVVIDQGGWCEVSIWGGHAARYAADIGLGGVVIDGACRDTAQILEFDVPHLVRATTARQGHGLMRSTCYMAEPVQVGMMCVAPGDLIIGDDDGIAVVPAARATAILALAQELQALEDGQVDGREARERAHEIMGLGPGDTELARLFSTK